MRPVVIFVETNRAIAAETACRERKCETPVALCAEELVEEWREAADDDQGPTAFPRHRAEDGAIGADHRLPPRTDAERCALVERDRGGGRGGDGHRHGAVGARPLLSDDAR